MKLTQWLKESNRHKHLLGGMAVAALAPCGWPGSIYAAVAVGAALEYKDKAHGCRFDYIDLAMTAAGGAIAAAVKWLLM